MQSVGFLMRWLKCSRVNYSRPASGKGNSWIMGALDQCLDQGSEQNTNGGQWRTKIEGAVVRDTTQITLSWLPWKHDVSITLQGVKSKFCSFGSRHGVSKPSETCEMKIFHRQDFMWPSDDTVTLRVQ